MCNLEAKKKKKTIGHSSIPLDLIIEILLKLPAKSVLRFRSVSKSWCSIIDSKQFTDDFMTLSLSRPRHVLGFSYHDEDRLLFLSSAHQNCSFGSSMLLVAEKNISTTLPEFKPYSLYTSNSVRGFVVLVRPYVVCNPTTRQVIYLPETNSDCEDCDMYLGYDPNSHQYKVLRLVHSFGHWRTEHSVCTLEAQGSSSSSYTWRPIKTNIPHYYYCGNGVCIDGVVYYECPYIQNYPIGIASFDVGSEQLCLLEIPRDLIEIPKDSLVRLTTYLGKLAVYCSDGNGFILCLLEDAKNQVWSKKTCVFSSSFTSSILNNYFSFSGITATGEIVYAPVLVSDSFELLCYDMEKKMERRVRVQSKDRGFSSSLLCSYVDIIATI